jgi:hypothetical protein
MAAPRTGKIGPSDLSLTLRHALLPCGCLALQDASTASLVWLLTLMAEYPDVLEGVRAEQAAARPNLAATITGETLAQMPYTRQVRESAPCVWL